MGSTRRHTRSAESVRALCGRRGLGLRRGGERLAGRGRETVLDRTAVAFADDDAVLLESLEVAGHRRGGLVEFLGERPDGGGFDAVQRVDEGVFDVAPDTGGRLLTAAANGEMLRVVTGSTTPETARATVDELAETFRT